LESEKTLAELIGWQFDGWIKPTVDDLLAWLQATVPGDYTYGPDDGPENGHFVYALWDDQGSINGDGRWDIEVRHSPTLLAALGQAVRKVNDEH